MWVCFSKTHILPVSLWITFEYCAATHLINFSTYLFTLHFTFTLQMFYPLLHTQHTQFFDDGDQSQLTYIIMIYLQVNLYEVSQWMMSCFLAVTGYPQEHNLDWFPRMRAMSLVSSDAEGEQNEIRNLQEKLESTMRLVANLSGQLTELKEQVQHIT